MWILQTATTKKCVSRHDWVGKGNLLRNVQESKIDQAEEWYMHKPESVLENEMHEILWDFEMQTILARISKKIN